MNEKDMEEFERQIDAEAEAKKRKVEKECRIQNFFAEKLKYYSLAEAEELRDNFRKDADELDELHTMIRLARYMEIAVEHDLIPDENKDFFVGQVKELKAEIQLFYDKHPGMPGSREWCEDE